MKVLAFKNTKVRLTAATGSITSTVLEYGVGLVMALGLIMWGGLCCVCNLLIVGR